MKLTTNVTYICTYALRAFWFECQLKCRLVVLLNLLQRAFWGSQLQQETFKVAD